MKKIIELTKILCKDYLERLPLFGKNSKKKSMFWLVIILNFCLVLLTYKILDFLNKIGQPDIFLNIYLLVINIIIMFQVALSSINIFFYSNELEYILPFPFKPIELLLAKFNSLLSIAYAFETMFLIVPLITYGIISAGSITFFVWLIPVLIVFPLFFTLVISIITQLIMLLSKYIKNKNVFQILTTFLITIIITVFELNIFNIAFNQEYMSGQIQIIGNVLEENIKKENNEEVNNQEIDEDKIEKEIAEELKEKLNFNEFKNNLKESNKRIITLNEITEILSTKNFFNNLINLIKVILYNLILLIIFLIIGNKLYLKNIIKNISIINIKKQNKIIKNNNKKIINNKFKIKNKKISNKNIAYLKNEIKELIKNPTYFLQCIIPGFLALITISLLLIIFFPILNQTFDIAEIISNEKIEFNNEFLVAILSLMQITFTFSNVALTTITRKGKKAYFLKYIPIDLYKQYLLLNMPQLIINNISIITILIIVKCLSKISIIYILAMFILSNLLNLINSFILLLIDFKRPNLNWDNETSAIKQNKNIIFQYAITIFNIIALINLYKIIEEIKINLNIFIFIIIIIYIIIFLIINIIIKKKIKNIFNKIN